VHQTAGRVGVGQGHVQAGGQAQFFDASVNGQEFPAALLIVFALMFLAVARNPVANRNLIPYGMLLKVSYCGVIFFHWFASGMPDMWKPFAVADLVFLAEWQVVGWEGESVVNKPYVAADSQGNVYITAPEYHQMVRFDATGKVLAVWGKFGSDVASVNMPGGIAVDAEGNVYVVDSANHRVLKFAPVE
jgi:hypothetical protein